MRGRTVEEEKAGDAGGEEAHVSGTVAEITGLRVETGGRAIVDGVNLRAVAGRVTALVGASGSGKTTTGLALLGEYPAGARVSGVVRAPEGLVGYVPQHPGGVLNPARRVGALLRDIARAQVRHLPRPSRRAEADRRVARALTLAQIPDPETTLRRHPHQLSGGQQQRVVLAQALLLGARAVVADEPTTGQDPLTKRRIVEELAAVARQGIAVVLLSHDLDVVRDLADEVLVLRAGRVVESGPVDRLWREPRHPWTAELLAAHGARDHGGGTHHGGGTGHGGGTDHNRGAGHGGTARPVAATEAGTAAETAAAAGADADAGAGSGSGGREVLRVRGLTARHGRTAVLRVPDLTLRAGECLAVVGRSGSGKTTLGRCLAGLHRGHDGDVRLDGAPLPRSLRDRTRAELAAVQYVFQDARASFDEHRAILAQVARTAVRLRGMPSDEALAEAVSVLGGLGLPADLVRRGPARLSGGELQRAALARALLARPRVLVCDEITSGLDTVTRRGILDTLTGLVRERRDLSLVLITHDLTTAALASRVAVLDAGDIVEEGPAHQILASPRHPFTTSLLTASLPRPERAHAGRAPGGRRVSDVSGG